MRFAPDLPQRRQLAEERKNLIQREGEGYGFMMGEYRQPLYVDEPAQTNQQRVEKLYGVEEDLAHLLAQYPGVLAEHNIDRPAILVDFGGMVGLSALRIAAQPLIRQKIEQGKIAIVVTNLDFHLSDQSSPSVKELLPFLGMEEQMFIEVFRRMVHYLKGDASTILRSSITLPDERTIQLKGNVDVVHERLALAHGFKNDLDIPRLGKLLSPVGQLWLGTKSNGLMQAADVGLRVNKTVQSSREQAHQLGTTNLEELGLHAVQPTRPMTYQIFKHDR